MKDIKNFIPKSKSISMWQILNEDYQYCDAFLIMLEMVDLIVLDLVNV